MRFVWLILAGLCLWAGPAGAMNQQEYLKTVPPICLDGEAASQQGRQAQAIKLLSKCLCSRKLSKLTRAIAYNDRGVARYRSGDYLKALKDLGNSLILTPSAHMPWYNRGLVYAAMGRSKMADSAYGKAIEFHPKFARAYTNRGGLRRQMGRPRAAIADFERAIELRPGHASAYGGRGMAWQNLGRFDLALRDMTKSIKLDAKEPALFYNRALAWINLKLFDRALADLASIVAINPKYAIALSMRAQVYLKLGQPGQAERDVAACLALEPKNPSAWLSRAVLHWSLNQTGPALADLDVVFSERPDLADIFFLTAWASNDAAPGGLDYAGLLEEYAGTANSAVAQYLQGKLAQRQRDPARAEAAYARAVELRPKFGPALLGLGHVLSAQDRYLEATEAFSDLLRFDFFSPDAWTARGQVWLKAGYAAMAAKDFNKAVEYGPESAKAWLDRARCYAAMGSLHRAIDYFSRAIDLEPSLDQAYYERGLAWARLGQAEKVKADFLAATSLSGRYICRMYPLGKERNAHLWPNIKMSELTIGVLETGVRAGKTGETAMADYKAGKFERAEAGYSKAIAIAPQMASQYLFRALVRMAQSRWAAALADLNQALSLDPGMSTAYKARAVVYKKLGQGDPAQADRAVFELMEAKSAQISPPVFDPDQTD